MLIRSFYSGQLALSADVYYSDTCFNCAIAYPRYKIVHILRRYWDPDLLIATEHCILVAYFTNLNCHATVQATVQHNYEKLQPRNSFEQKRNLHAYSSGDLYGKLRHA